MKKEKIFIYTKEKRYQFESKFAKDYFNVLLLANREDGPAYIQYESFDSKNIIMKQWLINGKLHREDGPALIMFYNNGKKLREEWYANGKIHRKGAPAIITYFPKQKINQIGWYLNGKYYLKQDYYVQMLKEKIKLI